MAPKRISILGSTGSIGRQALEVITQFPQRFKVIGLSAGENIELLARQALQFKVRMASITDEDKARELKKLVPRSVQIFCGEEGLVHLAENSDADLILMAVVGSAGLKPLIRAIKAQKTIALANKEPMVMAGKIITKLAKAKGAKIIPVDSEHSAIFQLLEGKPAVQIKKVILSASGGPFLRKKNFQLKNVTLKEVLAHPTWRMGKKITVDSATLMNKALEIIEAKWLFNLDPEQISVVIHPQSIVHSLVELCDSAVVAHLSLPDMRVPIAHALFYPERPECEFGKLDLAKIGSLQFEPPSLAQFPSLRLGFEALKAGGDLAAVMNAANEAAVFAFLSGNISFNKIVKLVGKIMNEHKPTEPKSLEDIMEVDSWARARVEELING